MVLAGALVEDSRENLVRIPPAGAVARRNTARVADRWRLRRALAEAAGGERLHAWRADGLAAWRAAMDRSLTGAGAGRPPLLGRIEASLADVRVRDAVLLTLVPGTGDLAERSLSGCGGGADGADGPNGADGQTVRRTAEALGRIWDSNRGSPPDHALATAGADVLEQVVAHARGGPQAPALTLLALLAWWQGDGARAGVLIDRALHRDPGHRLALLLRHALAGALSPGWLRRRG